MIKGYNNMIDEDVAKDLYNILIENLFIIHPEFIKEKELYDNQKNFNKWYSSIKGNTTYKMLIYYLDNKIVGFFSYSIVDNNLWISEVQIMDKYKNQKILKSFLKYFVTLEEFKQYSEIYLHINSKNILSQEVFKHIGFKNIEGTIYSIKAIDLINYN